MSDEAPDPTVTPGSVMAANAKSRDRQGKQQDRARRIAAPGKPVLTVIAGDESGPKIGKDTD